MITPITKKLYTEIHRDNRNRSGRHAGKRAIEYLGVCYEVTGATFSEINAFQKKKREERDAQTTLL